MKVIVIAISFILVVATSAVCYDNQGGYDNTTGYNNTLHYSNDTGYVNNVFYYDLFAPIQPRMQKVQKTVDGTTVQAIIEVNSQEDKSLQKDIK